MAFAGQKYIYLRIPICSSSRKLCMCQRNAEEFHQYHTNTNHQWNKGSSKRGGTVKTSMELLFTLFHRVHIMIQHLTCFWEAFPCAWFAHLNCNPHSLLKNHRGYPDTVCGLERAKPKVERRFQVSFSQQTFFAFARSCPLEVTVQDGSFCCIRVAPSGFNNTCAGGPTSFTLLVSVKSTKTLWFLLLEIPRICTSENVRLWVSRLRGLPVLGPWRSNLWTATQCCIWHSVQLDIPQKHNQIVRSWTAYIIISKPITSRPYGYDPTIC